MDQGEDLIVVNATEKGSEETDVFPTAAIFTTASVTTPYTRKTRASRGIIIESSPPIPVNIPSISKDDNGKGIMTEPEQPSKEKVLEQMSTRLARELEAKSLAQIKKYQAQQSKLATKAERRKFYMSVLRSNVEWKSKHFKGMTFEQIEEKFIPESSKKLKTSKASGSEPSQEQQTKEPKELSEKELKKMMEIVHVEEFYIQALQAKYPIIDWEIYSEEQRKIWIGFGVWSRRLSALQTRQEDKEKSLVEPERDSMNQILEDQLWALQKYMHDPLEWRLYDTCGVHHVSTRRGHEIFMLVEKDYPLKKGLTTVMLCNKLQVDHYSEMANELLMKIYSIANSPR
ncbi:hypothetical protein Tco_0383213 [Tanacetum coccineum]